jgi:DNA-binding LacI/PurR family transcriptional regulator
MIRSSHDFVGLGSRSAPIAEAMRSEIVDGIFGPGTKLPSLNELCGRFGVTRPTLRKAVERLVQEGLVVVRPGAGMFVCKRPDGPAGAASRTISAMYHFDSDSLYAIQQMAMSAGFLLCSYSQFDWQWDPAHERIFLEAVKAERCRALIAFCTPREPGNEDVLADLEALGTRVVHIEPYAASLPGQSYVIPDYEYAGAMAATELLLAGCRSYAFLPMNKSPFEILLERGFSRVLGDHGPGYDPARDRFEIKPFTGPGEPGAESLAEWLASRPKPLGLFCRASHNAAAVRAVALSLGLTIPGDVRLITFSQKATEAGAKVDELVVDRMGLVRRAIEAVSSPNWRGVRELVKPELIRYGSIKPA